MNSRVAVQDPLIERLRSATSINALVRFLHEELNWPVDLDAIDDAFYDYEPEDLGIKAEHQVAIQSIKQLRPLTSNQPWGIFFVEFDRQRLPMVVLRRVLQGLSLRNREKDKGRQRWHARDLLFISSFGPAKDREIALAHFTDETEHGDLPTLRVLGWDGADTNLALAQVATTLREHLRWPADGDTATGQQRWRERWSSAFRLGYREAVTTAKDLALALAYLARAIRTRANEVLAVEGPDGPLTKLFVGFKANLMADLSHDQFADMYAQTITYGLFAARVSRSSGGLVADDAALMIPSTNPFLQELLQDFLAVSGRTRAPSRRGRGTRIDFDELGVNAVVEQLRAAPMDAVLVSFNNARPGDDPVIHFYEDFLKAYDKAMRVERGVFYTPRPVVQFIVRSVHEVLQTEFGIVDGLASTVTWDQMTKRMPGLTLPKGTAPDSAFVQILDPAVGTATFLVEVVDLIHEHMRGKWQKAGLNKAQQLDAWNTYVRDHLLTRLHGFELMMAPYAIAHMKLGLKLADTGYRFPEGGPRVRVFLTNSLQPPSDVQPQFELMAPMLAHEARAANAAKGSVAYTAVIGNPPYSAISANLTDVLRRIVDRYRQFDGERIRERSMLQFEKNIQDDYIKFFALAERFLERSVGVLGYISNHSYLDAPTLRGFRQSLTRTFGRISICDLHGNANKGEQDLTGGVDQNVFAIRQGVAVLIGVRTSLACAPEVSLSDLYGPQASKLATLAGSSISSLPASRVNPERPLFQFISADKKTTDIAWALWPSVPQVFRVYSTGLETGFDAALVGFTAEEQVSLLRRFSKQTVKIGGVAEVKGPHAVKVFENRSSLAKVSVADLGKFQIRAFDFRTVLLRKDLLKTNSFGVLRDLGGERIALITTRQTKEAFCTFVVDSYAGHKITSSYDRAYVMPLFQDNGSHFNVFPHFLAAIRSVGRVAPTDGDEDVAVLAFRWIVGILSSPDYARRYEGELRRDWPRIPIPGSHRVLAEVAEVGRQLIDAYCLKVSEKDAPRFFGEDRHVSRVDVDGPNSSSGAGHALLIVNTGVESGFRGVAPDLWKRTIGGHQVLQKWLDERRKAGRSLTDEDIAHWRRIYVALETAHKLMIQVDEVIERHGGWPNGPGEGGAFSLDHPPPSAEVLAAQAAARPRGRRRPGQTGQQSLLNGDEEPEPAPARPKAAPLARSSRDDLDHGEAMCAVRTALAQAAGSLSRDELVRATARAMGYGRASSRLADALDDAVRRAVRRGIAANQRGSLALASRSIEDYERDALKTHLLAVVRAQSGSVPREDVPRLLARWLGFGRTGRRIVEATESALRSLVRSGELQAQDGVLRPALAMRTGTTRPELGRVRRA